MMLQQRHLSSNNGSTTGAMLKLIEVGYACSSDDTHRPSIPFFFFSQQSQGGPAGQGTVVMRYRGEELHHDDAVLVFIM